MSVKDTDETLIDDVCSRVRELLADDSAADAEAFVRQFYRWVPPEELVERDALDLYGLAVGQLGFARRRRPGQTRLRVYNPVFETHGWSSTHTAVEIVTDDKPFLIDSISMELNRRGFGVHLMIHPVMDVRRDAEGNLVEVLAPGADDEDAIGESVIHAEVDRQTDHARLEELRSELLRVIGEVSAAVDDWPLMRERALGLAAELSEAPPKGLDRGDRGGPRLHRVARGPQLHVPRLPRVRARHRGRRAAPERRPGLGPRHPPPGGRREELACVQQAPAGGARARSRAPPPEPDEGQLALHRAPARLSRLRRREALRRRGTGHGRAPLPRALHAHGLPVARQRHTDPQAQGEHRADARGVPARQPQREGADRDPRAHPRDELIQVDPDELYETAIGILHLGERQRLRLFVRRDRFGRSFVPRVRAARPLQHGEPAPDRGDSPRRDRRPEPRLHNPRLGVRAGSAALHGLHRARPAAERGHADRRADDGGGDTLVDRRPRAGADRGPGRGARKELFRRYAEAFPTAYRADWVARSALADIRHIDELPDHGGLRDQPLQAARCRSTRWRGSRRRSPTR